MTDSKYPNPDRVVVITDAPESYDWAYTERIAPISEWFWIVAIEPEGADYQCSRYESGMYTCTTVTFDGDLEQILYLIKREDNPFR